MFCKPKCRIPEIDLIRGNTGSYSPALLLDDEPLETLGKGEFILFIVKSALGTTYLSRTLAGSVDGTPITFEFKPEDTIELSPFRYEYSIDYYIGNGISTYYTLERGIFNLIPEVGNIKDIKKGE